MGYWGDEIILIPLKGKRIFVCRAQINLCSGSMVTQQMMCLRTVTESESSNPYIIDQSSFETIYSINRTIT